MTVLFVSKKYLLNSLVCTEFFLLVTYYAKLLKSLGTTVLEFSRTTNIKNFTYFDAFNLQVRQILVFNHLTRLFWLCLHWNVTCNFKFSKN